MALIFGASTDLLSGSRTSRFIGPFLRWFDPEISETSIRQFQLMVRKGAHVAEYAILSVLVCRALRLNRGVPAGNWCRRSAAIAFLIAAGYAVTDEWHQSFVPSRDGSPHDAIIDMCGAALGLALLWRWHFLQQPRGLRPPA